MKDFFISHKNPLTVVLVLILISGWFAYEQMKTSLFPEITFPKIKIIADAELQPVDKMMITITLQAGEVVRFQHIWTGNRIST